MRVAAQNHVDTRYARRHFQVNIHTIVRQKHDGLRTFGTCFVDRFLHLHVLYTECPIRHLPAWIGNRRIWKRLTDDGEGHAIHLFQHIRFENWVFKVFGFDVLRYKINFTSEILLNDFHHTSFAVGELPVRCHHIHAQQLANVNHVLCIRPQAGRATLPRVATV